MSVSKYAQVNMIIQSYERGAMLSNNRSGQAATFMSPLRAIKSMSDGVTEASDKRALEYPDNEDDEFSIKAFAREMFGDDGAANEWMRKCLGCDIKFDFDFELLPWELVNPLSRLLDELERLLEMIELALNDFGPIEDLCLLLNALKLVCLPQILQALAALRARLRHAALNALKVSFDWTSIFGGMLSAILTSITAAIGNLKSMFDSGLDCALTSLKTTAQIQREAAALIEDLSRHSTPGLLETELEIFRRDVSQTNEPFVEIDGEQSTIPYLDSDVDQDAVLSATVLVSGDDGKLDAAAVSSSRGPLFFDDDPEDGSESVVSFPTSFALTSDMTLDEAMLHPKWGDADWAAKLIIPIQDAKKWLNDLLTKIQRSIQSLNALVGQGVTVQIANTAIVMYLTNMIRILMTAMRLLASFPDILDWCKEAEENPERLHSALEEAFPGIELRRTESTPGGSGSTAATDIVYAGRVIKTLPTCMKKGDVSPQVEQWIRELEAMKPS